MPHHHDLIHRAVTAIRTIAVYAADDQADAEVFRRLNRLADEIIRLGESIMPDALTTALTAALTVIQAKDAQIATLSANQISSTATPALQALENDPDVAAQIATLQAASAPPAASAPTAPVETTPAAAAPAVTETATPAVTPAS